MHSKIVGKMKGESVRCKGIVERGHDVQRRGFVRCLMPSQVDTC